MPTYTYRCLDCGETFEQVEHILDHDAAHTRCPRCESSHVEPVITTTFVKTSKKS